MKANRKFVEEKEAVSAVIGVILMVAITVAIAATVYVYVSGMLGGGTQSTPSVSLTAAPGSGHDCLLTVGTITETGILWSDCDFTIVDVTDTDELTNGTDVDVAWSGGTVTGGDIITIIETGGTSGFCVEGNQYRFTLSYSTTGGTMGTVTWTQ